MLFLARSSDSSDGGEALFQASAISKSQAIPEHYLRQILSQLRAAGLVRSVRGPSGGHGLARAPSDISVGEIIQCLEGTLTCVEGILDMPCTIEVGPQHCVIKEFLLDVKAQIEALVYGTSLADMARRQIYLSERAVLVQPRFLRQPSGKSRAREYTDGQVVVERADTP